eukprot:scaffold219030_cov22-Tisochrysis_lutea.AAC.1
MLQSRAPQTLILPACRTSGTCTCRAGYTGDDCSLPKKRECYNMGPHKRDKNMTSGIWLHTRCAGVWPWAVAVLRGKLGLLDSCVWLHSLGLLEFESIKVSHCASAISWQSIRASILTSPMAVCFFRPECSHCLTAAFPVCGAKFGSTQHPVVPQTCVNWWPHS